MGYKDDIYETGRLKIAVTGKGGVGKTIIAALMSRFFVGTKRKLLLVDADPALGLAYALGVEPDKNVGNFREKLIKQPALKTELGRMSMKDMLLRETLLELNGFSFLIMGKEESTGCYCPVNNLLKYGIGVLSKEYDIMLVDCEAGLEQIHRRVISTVDTLFIVTDMSARGIKTSIKIKDLIESKKAIKKCNRFGLIINRVKEEGNIFREIIEENKLDIFGSIPEDENISRLDLKGRPITEISDTSPSVIAVHEILKHLKLI